MASLGLTFDLLARDQASQKFRDVGNAADRAGKQTSGFGTSVGSAMKLAAGAFLGAGLIEGFKSLYEAADESRKIGALTGAVIKSTGGAANVSAKQVSDLAGAIAAKTGVDDEAIQSGQNLLLTFTNVRNETGKGNDIFNQATQAVTDMSVALGKDAPSSAVLLGKALNDPIKGMGALSRAGVQFTEQQKTQIRTLVESGDVLGAQKIILAELGTQFGGAAEAAATPLDKLRVKAGNLAEQFGGYLLPAVDKASTFVSEKLVPAFESLGPVLVSIVVPAFKAIGTAVSTVLDAFNALPGPVQVGLVAFGAIAALKGPVGGALETIGLRALYMKDALVNAGSGIGGLKAAGGGLLSFLGGPWGLAIGAATVGVSFLASSLGKSDKATEEAAAATRDYAGALESANGEINKSVRQAAAKAASDAGLLDVTDELGISAARVTDAITKQGGALESVQAKLRAYADTETTVITDANGQVTTSLSKQGQAALDALSALNQLSGQTGTTTKDQEQIARATATSAAATETFAQKIELAREELDEGKKAIDDFKLALDLLSGETVSLIQVESAFQAATAQAKDAMKELGGTVLDSSGNLNLQSENGRIAADVLLDVRNSGNTLIATMKEQGATTAEVQKKDAELRQSFINTAKQMGISDAAAFALADQILGIPSERRTTILANTDPAQAALDRFLGNYNGKTLSINVAARIAGGATINSLGLAAGGRVPGSSPTSIADNIPAMLTAGEWVHPVAATNYYGPEIMSALQKRQIPKESIQYLATGGMVANFMSQMPFGVKINPNDAAAGIQAIAKGVAQKAADAIGIAGSGPMGGAWGSIWQYVKSRVPGARINSTFRPGDPGYHGRGKAIDFGFGSGPGGAGSAGLALINRILHDGVGRNLAELIYNGVGDDRANIKNGRPFAYSPGTQAAHRNHVHAAVYDQGGILPPGLTLAYNGTGQNETIRTAGQERSMGATVSIGQFVAAGQSPTEIAEALSWMARTRA